MSSVGKKLKESTEELKQELELSEGKMIAAIEEHWNLMNKYGFCEDTFASRLITALDNSIDIQLSY